MGEGLVKSAIVFQNPVRDNGSVLVIVLLILVLLTMGGITAINLSVAESYIVRNSGFHAQNRQLAELAAMEGLRSILGERNPARLNPGAQEWFWTQDDWNTLARGKIPDHNYAVPGSVTEKTIKSIERRGEATAGTLRYFFVGWEDAEMESITIGDAPRWRKGKVIGVYDSPRYGRAWTEVGVIRKF
jgi:hypothetical protein